MIPLSVLGVSSRSASPNGRRIISDVTMCAEPGMLTAVVGPSGAGKSTLLDLVTGIEVPATGTVLLGEKRMHPASGRSRARLRARVFATARQSDDLIDAMSVDENVLLGQRLAGKVDRQLAARVFGALDLDHRVRRSPVQHVSAPRSSSQAANSPASSSMHGDDLRVEPGAPSRSRITGSRPARGPEHASVPSLVPSRRRR